MQVDLADRPGTFTSLYQSVSGNEHLGKVPIVRGVRAQSRC